METPFSRVSSFFNGQVDQLQANVLAEKKGFRGKSSGSLRLHRELDTYAGPARSFLDLCQAFRLVHREYKKCGYESANRSGLRFTLFQFLSNAKTMVMVQRGHVVGTASVVVSSPAGLPSSHVFGEEYDKLKKLGRCVAEGTMLACVASGNMKASRISREIIRWGVCWAAAQGVDDFCVVVNPKHVKFWNQTLGFEILSGSRGCPHVKDHPGVLLRLDIKGIFEGLHCPTEALSQIIIQRWIPAERFNSLFEIGEDELTLLFVREPDVLNNLDVCERRLLEARFPRALAVAELNSVLEEMDVV